MAASLPTLTFPSVRDAIPQPFHGPLRRLLVRALRLLPLPQHVAFIMDGNRRKARNDGLEVIKGHEKGFEALKTVSSNEDKYWPLCLCITATEHHVFRLTPYSFSISCLHWKSQT